MSDSEKLFIELAGRDRQQQAFDMSDSEILFIDRINLLCRERVERNITITDFQSFIANVVKRGMVAVVSYYRIREALEFCDEFKHIITPEEGNIFLDMKGYP